MAHSRSSCLQFSSPLGGQRQSQQWWRVVTTYEQFLGSRVVAMRTGGNQVARVLVLAPQPDPKPTPVPQLKREDEDDNLQSNRIAQRLR